jgi:phospholipid transport system substrate-binding protein
MTNGLHCRPVLLLVVVLLSVFVAADAGAQEVKPLTVVAAFQNELLATMKEAKVLGFEGRYERLLPAMDLAFDFAQITRVAVGRDWVKMTKTEQEQVVDLFRRFSVSTYARTFSNYDGQLFEIGGARSQAGFGTIIETRLVPRNKAPVELAYLLHETPAGWKIVDVYLAGTISELARRRAEFADIIRRQGVAGLIGLLKKKNDELAGD